MKKYLKPIIISIVLFVCFCLIGYLCRIVNSLSNETGRAYAVFMYSILQFNFGLILGFQKFRMNITNNGFWKINLTRLFSLGIPSLFVGMYLYLCFTNIPYFSDAIRELSPFLSNSFIQLIAQISFGYVLITSFYKKSIKQSSLTSSLKD